MSAREQMLRDIRMALGRDPAQAALAPAPLTRQRRVSSWASEPEALLARFMEKAGAVHATCARVANATDMPAEVLRYLRAGGIPLRAVLAEELAGYDWAPDLSIRYSAANHNDVVGVTVCAAGVAETGSLVMTSSRRTPTTLNFVPDVHIAVLHCAHIVATLEDALAKLRQPPSSMPRTINVITGPSRTADVEQTVEIGVHGPRRVHIVLLDHP